jgi:hypothetical protein
MRHLLLLYLGASLFFACAESFDHDHNMAAKRAEEFGLAVFVGRDLEKGYAMLSDSGKRYVPLEKFKETVVKSHPKSYPLNLTASGYEPMSGEKAIYVYLSGENAGEQFSYTVILDGTAATDYKVTRFSRGSSGGSRQTLSR